MNPFHFNRLPFGIEEGASFKGSKLGDHNRFAIPNTVDDGIPNSIENAFSLYKAQVVSLRHFVNHFVLGNAVHQIGSCGGGKATKAVSSSW